jgi:hypothetical protein
MIFFFKKKPIELVCVTKSTEVLQHAPIQKANKFIPDWWKQLPQKFRPPNKIFDMSTMKHCTGFVDYYTNGVMIPMWCDLALRIGPIGTDLYEYQFADRISKLTPHNPKQYGNHFDKEHFQHLKIISPWVFSCKEDIKFLNTEPTWTFIRFPTLRALPGIVNYKHQGGTNINIMVYRTEQEQQFVVPFLEPMYHIIPMSDRPIKLILSDDKQECEKIASKSYASTFVNKYKTNLYARKVNK